jgi:hypothetical protein
VTYTLMATHLERKAVTWVRRVDTVARWIDTGRAELARYYIELAQDPCGDLMEREAQSVANMVMAAVRKRTATFVKGCGDGV